VNRRKQLDTAPAWSGRVLAYLFRRPLQYNRTARNPAPRGTLKIRVLDATLTRASAKSADSG